MSPVYTGAATKYRVCGLCGRQAPARSRRGVFPPEKRRKELPAKSPYSPSWPVFPRALSPRQGWGTGRRPLRDNLAAAAAYGAALRRNSCLEPQRKSRRRNRFSRPPPSGGTADEAGARPLRKALRTFLPARRKSSGGTRRRADGRICPASAQGPRRSWTSPPPSRP